MSQKMEKLIPDPDQRGKKAPDRGSATLDFNRITSLTFKKMDFNGSSYTAVGPVNNLFLEFR